jgi:hypothetical protein
VTKSIQISYSHESKSISNTEKIVALKNELLAVLEQDGKRDITQVELSGIENDIYEFTEAVDEWYDYDPSPQYLYDNDAGEPLLSAAERWNTAFTEKQALHS